MAFDIKKKLMRKNQSAGRAEVPIENVKNVSKKEDTCKIPYEKAEEIVRNKKLQEQQELKKHYDFINKYLNDNNLSLSAIITKDNVDVVVKSVVTKGYCLPPLSIDFKN